MSYIRRKFKLALACSAAMFVLSGMAHANGIIDPQMKMLEDELSDAITQGFQFAPNGSGGGVFGFFNATGQTITEITIETLIRPNISQDDIATAFVCNQGSLNPFFLFCRIDYAPVNGRLTFAFWGTDLPVGHPGVVPLPAGCTAATADQPGCTGTGHFAISLSDGPTIQDTSGGWSSGLNPLLFYEGGPTFTVTEIQNVYGAIPHNIATVPEPGTILLMGGALAGLVWLRKRRRPLA